MSDNFGFRFLHKDHKNKYKNTQKKYIIRSYFYRGGVLFCFFFLLNSRILKPQIHGDEQIYVFVNALLQGRGTQGYIRHNLYKVPPKKDTVQYFTGLCKILQLSIGCLPLVEKKLNSAKARVQSPFLPLFVFRDSHCQVDKWGFDRSKGNSKLIHKQNSLQQIF